jgi:hypothetical protein
MSMFFKMSESLQREGIQYGKRWTTRFNAPKQLDTTSTDPTSVLCTLFTLTSRCWVAIRPRSFPLYTLAASVDSKNDPTIFPRPFCALKNIGRQAKAWVKLSEI